MVFFCFIVVVSFENGTVVLLRDFIMISDCCDWFIKMQRNDLVDWSSI